MRQAEFDRFAGSYEKDLAKSLSVTGEGREYYAQGRIDWTSACLDRLRYTARRILDYGCGDGANVPLLDAKFQPESVLGVDVSKASIEVARRTYSNDPLCFRCLDEWTPDGSMDLVFTNGVFHHIPPAERGGCLATIRRSLRSGGLFAFWENNPWNPGTQYVMSQCAFDENAVKISPREAVRALAQAGFRVLRRDSMFYFPRQLSFLRPLERRLSALPLGGQYLVLCENH